MEAKKQILFASRFAHMYYQYVSDAFKDYSLHSTQNGKQAVNYLKRNTPNVVILGENLEDLNTIKLCRAIRKSSRLSTTKILLLVPDDTNIDDIDDEAKTLADSILCHTQKPAKFVTHIEKLLKVSELEQEVMYSNMDTKVKVEQHNGSTNHKKEHQSTIQSPVKNPPQQSLEQQPSQQRAQVLHDTGIPKNGALKAVVPVIPTQVPSDKNAYSIGVNGSANSQTDRQAVAMHMPESTRMHELNSPTSGIHKDMARAIPQIPIKATNTYETSFPEEAPAKTIAIIEDNASIAFLEKSILERQGYNTIQISDAPQARDFVDTNFDMADLILLDLNLPGGSGFEILRRIRSFSRKPVIIVSGLKQSENIKRGLSLGAQDYLTKPMNPQELVLRVSQHIKNFT